MAAKKKAKKAIKPAKAQKKAKTAVKKTQKVAKKAKKSATSKKSAATKTAAAAKSPAKTPPVTNAKVSKSMIKKKPAPKNTKAEVQKTAKIEGKTLQPKQQAGTEVVTPQPKIMKSKKASVKKKKMTRAETEALAKFAKLAKKWKSLFERSRNIKAPIYSMSKTFEENAPIRHKILGWGYVMSNQNDRLEVIFEKGMKTLISNYQR